MNLLQLFLFLTLLSAFYREKKKRLHSAADTSNHECLLEWRKLAGINKWQTQYISNGLCSHECLKLELCCGTICIQTPTFLMYAASLFYLTHIINVWGCTEILPTHCGTGSVKVNYYLCMWKIWGLVKPHKVNKLQMRLPYYRIYSNTVCNMKKHNISLHKYSFDKKKSYFGCTLSDLCGVLTWARCFANFFRVRTFQNLSK